MTTVDENAKRRLRDLVRKEDTTCRWCGQSHVLTKCPLVKSLEYFEGGKIVRRVEFFSARDNGIARRWGDD